MMIIAYRCLLGRFGLVGVLISAFASPGIAEDRVVVYSALDREFSEPILKAYEKSSGIGVLAKFDVESTKTVGLTNLIIAEARRPRCDLFWNNEILNTLRLKEKGLLAPFEPGRAGEVPATFKDKEGMWYGFAARARILIVNTKLVTETERPKGIKDLLDPKWKGKIGIAKPLFGTTATHAACLFAAWGDEKAKGYFRDLKANGVQVFSGNKQVATAVGASQIAFGMTDTDDAMGELDAGSPVVIVYPDRNPGDLGTLFIPNTLAIMKGSPHQKTAEALADHLLSPTIESELARGPSAQIPLLKSTDVEARVETPKTVHPMEAQFDAAAKLWDKVAAFLASEFASE
jgi:iron(III) transport system substrate-binding protein